MGCTSAGAGSVQWRRRWPSWAWRARFLDPAAGDAVVAHAALGFTWWVSLLLGTAVAPTDPAVVFSVLGQREPEGRSGTLLEGESGANDDSV